MIPERKLTVNGFTVEEFLWTGKAVVYVENRKVETDFDATCKLLLKPGQRIVKNLMSGKPIVLEQDTPHCCDPSNETYWSM